MTTKTADTSKSLLAHLMVAGTAALAGSAANAQIVVTNVNENIGFAPGDVSSFVSSLPGPVQFNIFRESFTGLGIPDWIEIQSQNGLPTSRGAYLNVMAQRQFIHTGYGKHGGHTRIVPGSIETVPAGEKWGSIEGIGVRSDSVAKVYLAKTWTGFSSSNTRTLSNTNPSRDRFTDGYFAFQFTDANRGYQLDYGWIKASLTDDTLNDLNLHIDSYAYDPTGAQIAMGDAGTAGTTVPEPNAALALAALSALTLGTTSVKRFKALQHVQGER
jgi:hypothetical protein